MATKKTDKKPDKKASSTVKHEPKKAKIVAKTKKPVKKEKPVTKKEPLLKRKMEAVQKVETMKPVIEAPGIEVVKHPAMHKPEKKEKRPPKRTFITARGGRKTSIARVRVSGGSGKYIINGRPMEVYTCGRRFLNNMALQPFVITSTVGKYDVYANVCGGGICSQIGAVRQAVSRAVITMNPELKATIKKAGLLTRDPRVKERKKYGQKRARKRFQFSKR